MPAGQGDSVSYPEEGLPGGADSDAWRSAAGCGESDREEPTQRGPAGRGSSWPCRCAPADLVHLKYCDPGMGQ